MKILGQPIAFAITAMVLFLLAVMHPIVWLMTQQAAGRDGSEPHAAARYIALLEGSGIVREKLHGQEVIGYASEAEVDIKTGGPVQARYYLSQFALAPVLVELESAPATSDAEFVLANFEFPGQLRSYLIEQSRRAVVPLNDYVALTRKRDH